MSLIVVLICLAVQWFLQFSSANYQFCWEKKYFQWMRSRCDALTKGHALFTALLLVLPVVIIASFLFSLVYHLFGHVGYCVLSLALLWYCVDLTPFKQLPTHSASPTHLFIQAYQKLFAPLFWYFVFGPIGLVLYVLVVALHQQASDQRYFALFLNVLDWVPTRLVGLSFALVGNFSVVFREWMKTLSLEIVDNYQPIIACGEAAIDADKKNQDALSIALQLVQRGLLVWLVVMILMKVGGWIG